MGRDVLISEIEDIKKNIRIIAEKLGLEFESNYMGDYLLEKQKSYGKIGELEENIKRNIERIERLENRVKKLLKKQYIDRFGEIKDLVNSPDFRSRSLTFKGGTDYKSEFYRVYHYDNYRGKIKYNPVCNEYEFEPANNSLEFNYNMLLEITGFIDKLNRGGRK